MALAAGAILLVAGGIWLAVDAAQRLVDARTRVFAARSDLDAARPVFAALAASDGGRWPAPDELPAVRASLERAHANLAAAEARLGYVRFLLLPAELIPQARGASEVPLLIGIARRSTAAGLDLMAAFSPILEPTESENRLTTTARARIVVVDRAGQIDATLATLVAMDRDMARLRQRPWGRWLRAVPNQLDAVAPYLAQAAATRDAFVAVRDGFDPLFGFDRPRTYLVIGQNEAEIRATGGFMGSMGVVTIAEGRIAESAYDRVEAFEPPWPQARTDPPIELRRHMGATLWLLRDTNESPDFPTSARIAMDFIARDRGLKTDGVIALTTLTLGRLVDLYQPLEIDEYAEPLRSDNWRRVVENTLQMGGSTPERTYLTPLMRRLIAQMQQSERRQLGPLLAALVASTRARDLQLYAADERAERMAERLGVAGRLAAPPPGGRDLVAVVDRNMSWSKVGAGIQRDTLYLAGANGQVDLRVRWENNAARLDPRSFPRAMRYGEIWNAEAHRTVPDIGVFGNYVSVFLPSDATDIVARGWASNSIPRLERVDGLLMLSGFVVVRSGESKNLFVSFRLPGERKGVTIWKQGGQAHDTLTILRNRGNQQHRLFDGPFTRDVSIGY